MARQKGSLPFTGAVGNIVGFQRNGEFFLKEKNLILREKVLHTEAFARTRENAAEWRQAVRAGMLVRHALVYLVKFLRLADNHLSARLNALMSRVVQSDPVSERGKRKAGNGQLEWIEDFAFRKETAFVSVCSAGPASTIDTSSGLLKLEIAPFYPRERIMAPEGATHFRIIANAAALHFEQEYCDRNFKESIYYPLGEPLTDRICLEQSLDTVPAQCLLQAMGVSFYVQRGEQQFDLLAGGVMRVLQVAATSHQAIHSADSSPDWQ